jgi:hypothetical protein
MYLPRDFIRVLVKYTRRNILVNPRHLKSLKIQLKSKMKYTSPLQPKHWLNVYHGKISIKTTTSITELSYSIAVFRHQ